VKGLNELLNGIQKQNKEIKAKNPKTKKPKKTKNPKTKETTTQKQTEISSTQKAKTNSKQIQKKQRVSNKPGQLVQSTHLSMILVRGHHCIQSYLFFQILK